VEGVDGTFIIDVTVRFRFLGADFLAMPMELAPRTSTRSSARSQRLVRNTPGKNRVLPTQDLVAPHDHTPQRGSSRQWIGRGYRT
jgi:hypothetical protein